MSRKNKRIWSMTKEPTRKPDEIFILNGCRVQVYYAPKVRRALAKKRKKGIQDAE